MNRLVIIPIDDVTLYKARGESPLAAISLDPHYFIERIIESWLLANGNLDEEEAQYQLINSIDDDLESGGYMEFILADDTYKAIMEEVKLTVSTLLAIMVPCLREVEQRCKQLSVYDMRLQTIRYGNVWLKVELRR